MPRHLMEDWREIENLLRQRALLIFCDFDGTLAPIVPNPDDAKLSSGEKKAIRDLSCLQEVQIVIVTGRSMAEIKRKVDIPELLYVANHGLEIDGPKIQYVHPGALSSKKNIMRMAAGLREALSPIPGIFVEDKVYTLSVHYRRVPPERVAEAENLFKDAVRNFQKESQVMLREGKKVWELRPCFKWDKGTAVMWLFARASIKSRKRLLPVYLGDDQTDEDAFKALKRKGLAIKVTTEPEDPTSAVYFLRSPEEVFDFLRRVKKIKQETLNPGRSPSPAGKGVG